MLRILVCALEPSANVHLKELLRAYFRDFGGFELCGIFDEKMMRELECELLSDAFGKKGVENSYFTQDYAAQNLDENHAQNLQILNETHAKNSQKIAQTSQDLRSQNSQDNSQNSVNFLENLQNLDENCKKNSQDLRQTHAQNLQNNIFIHKPLFNSHEFSAMGFVEVLPLIFKAKRAISLLVNVALERQNFCENSQNLNEIKAENSRNLEQIHAQNLQNPQSENLQISSQNSQNPSQNSQKNSQNSVNFSANSPKNSHNQAPAKPLDIILCIDSPAFNIPLAKALNKANIKATKCYYILPQVWAWKKGRIPTIEANFDLLASILPFDEQFFSKCVFMGHPLLDEIKDFKDEKDFERTLKKDEKQKIISFLPGSRQGEIKRLMPIFRELAANFKGEKMLCVPPFNLNKIKKLYGDTEGFKIVTSTPQALKKSDFAFVCSGTATLEAALIGTPFILAYKAKAIDVLIARLFVRLKHIGLANIMCDFAGQTPLHPEFLQDEVSAKNLFEAYRRFDYKEFFGKVSFLKKYLGFGSAKNLAKALWEHKCK